MGGPLDGCQIHLLGWRFARRNIHGTDSYINLSDFSLVCHLNKYIYALKHDSQYWYAKINNFHDSQDWYAKMNNFLLDTNFSKFHFDPNVYTKKVHEHLIILVLYVDGLTLAISDAKLLSHMKSNLKKKFEITNLGHLHYFLGL